MPIEAIVSALTPGCEGPQTVGRAGGTKADRKNATGTQLDGKRLDRACAEFEALLVQKLFQTMRASIPKSGLIDGGSAEEIYTTMLDQKVAEEMAFRGGLGLSDRIKAQILGRLSNPKVQND